MKTALLAVLFLTLGSAFAPLYALAQPEAQIFDPAQGKIVRSVPAAPAIQNEARAILQTSTYPDPQTSIQAGPGLVLRIPLEPPFVFNEAWYRGPVTEVFIFTEPVDSRKRLLFFTPERRALVVNYTGDVRPLLEKIQQRSTN